MCQLSKIAGRHNHSFARHVYDVRWLMISFHKVVQDCNKWKQNVDIGAKGENEKGLNLFLLSVDKTTLIEAFS